MAPNQRQVRPSTEFIRCTVELVKGKKDIEIDNLVQYIELASRCTAASRSQDRLRAESEIGPTRHEEAIDKTTEGHLEEGETLR